MSFRARLIAAVMGTSLLVLGLAFASLYALVQASELRQLDAALLREAFQEAREAGQHETPALVVRQRPGPVTDDTGPLTRFAAIVDDDGEVLDRTSTLRHGVPEPSEPDELELGEPFDVIYEGQRLRAVRVAIPRTDAELFLATPRTFLDADATFLIRAMLIVLFGALACGLLVSSAVMGRLTRDHEAIARAVQAVARGDLEARAAVPGGGGETAQLARDVNHMIERIAESIAAHQRFIAHASHELRSPLTLLKGELELALRRERAAEEYREAIREALSSTQELTRLAEHLLALARVEEGRALGERVALHELVDKAVEAAEREELARGVTLDAELAPAVVEGATMDLERAAKNLLHNALRFSPEGGVVRVRLEVEGDDAVLSVEDEGPGIPEAHLEHVFEPFYRGPQDGARMEEGSGLGLAFVREVARAHGGRAFAERGARGARVGIVLPVDRSERAARP